MCVLNVFNFTNVKLHLLQRNCSLLPQYSCNIKLLCFMSLALLTQLPQTEKSENLIKTKFLRDSASSFLNLQLFVRSFVPHRWHLLSSPLYDISEHKNHIFSERIWSWQHVSANKYSVAELKPSLLFFSVFNNKNDVEKVWKFFLGPTKWQEWPC